MLPSRKASSSCPNFAPRAAFTTASACPTPRPHDSAYAAAGAVTSCPSLRGGGPAAAPPNSHCRVPLIPFFQRRDAPFVLRLSAWWWCAVAGKFSCVWVSTHIATKTKRAVKGYCKDETANDTLRVR